jgi:hypothetical protein
MGGGDEPSEREMAPVEQRRIRIEVMPSTGRLRGWLCLDGGGIGHDVREMAHIGLPCDLWP